VPPVLDEAGGFEPASDLFERHAGDASAIGETVERDTLEVPDVHATSP
jgi:hypothetical protein